MAITPIQPGGVVRLDRFSGSGDSASTEPSGAQQTLDKSTTDLSIQNARQGSLLYQVVDKLVSDTGSSESAMFSRLLSSKLADNDRFVASLSSSEPATNESNNIISIKAYQLSAEPEQTKVGGLIDIRESD